MRKLGEIFRKFWFPLVAAAVLSCIYFLLWPNFWVIYATCVFALMFLLLAIDVAIDNDESIGCSSMVVVGIAIVLAIIWHDERYIGSGSHYQHYYSDCSTLSKGTGKKVYELEGFFHLFFSDCDTCKQRVENAVEKLIKEEEAQERRELATYLQKQIDKLNNGKDADEVESDILEHFGYSEEDEDDSDYNPHIPSRYQ